MVSYTHQKVVLGRKASHAHIVLLGRWDIYSSLKVAHYKHGNLAVGVEISNSFKVCCIQLIGTT